MSEIIEKILKLKEEKGAVILAHNYVNAEIQDIADFTGDSLELSIKAKNSKAGVIVFCGVSFMAETAKLLSPDSTVLHPVKEAGCPMADMAKAEDIAAYREKNPDTVLIAIDVLEYVRPSSRGGNLYKEDYADMEGHMTK